jgi:hypothetical protein
MFLQDLNDVRGLFDSLGGTFVGIGMTAFSRIIPAYFIHPYYIVALRKTCDLQLLKEKGHIFCLEAERGEPMREQHATSTHLLAHPLARDFLSTLPNPKHLLLYQGYPELESLAQLEGWVFLANQASLRMRVGERAFFEKLLTDLQLPMIPGGIFPIDVIRTREYKDWAEMTGPRFVVQLPEIHQGGGKGTFFINSGSGYERLQERLKYGTWCGTALTSVSIHQQVEGIAVSMAICLTRNGVLFSGPQRQLIDLPNCKGLKGDGVFCGHVWGEPEWSSSLTQEVHRQARMIGDHLAALGYKGIAGIDFMIDKKSQQVYPIELNPRFTGAFPMLSLLHIKKGLIPLEAFHMLEFLGVPYEADVDQLNDCYSEGVRGSHILLFLLSGGKDGVIRELKAGLYELDRDEQKISFVKGAVDYGEIEKERQFIVIDGPPDTAGEALWTSDPHYRLCRLLFSYPVADDAGALSDRALKAVEAVYGSIFRGSS